MHFTSLAVALLFVCLKFYAGKHLKYQCKQASTTTFAIQQHQLELNFKLLLPRVANVASSAFVSFIDRALLVAAAATDAEVVAVVYFWWMLKTQLEGNGINRL